jgi:hypothetical protein
MRKIILLLLLLAAFTANAQTFRIKIADTLKQPLLDGRLLLLLSDNNKSEPRFQVGDALNTQMVFGEDVENWQPGTSQLVDVHAFGYPIEKLSDVPAGDYYVQALLHKYENPSCTCEVDYGDRAEHCWNGDHTQPNYISRLRYHQMYIKKWAEEIKTRAPKGADLTSWRY